MPKPACSITRRPLSALAIGLSLDVGGGRLKEKTPSASHRCGSTLGPFPRLGLRSMASPSATGFQFMEKSQIAEFEDYRWMWLCDAFKVTAVGTGTCTVRYDLKIRSIPEPGRR